MPKAIRRALRSYKAAASAALLLQVEVDDASLAAMKDGARALEEVASAAQAVAEAIRASSDA